MPSIRTSQIKELRAKRASLAAEARSILDGATDGTLTTEQQTRFDALHAEIEQLRSRIESEERQMDLDAELAAPQEVRSRTADGAETGREVSGDERAAAQLRYSEAFGRAIRGQATSDDRHVMQARAAALTPEQRALSVGSDSAGGYAVPEGFANQLTEAMLAFGGMRASRATVLNTMSGATLPYPTTNDTANAGAILAENAQVTEQDTTFGVVNIGAFMYTSKLVRVSLQLLQDSAFDMEAYLARMLGTRVARITNTHFTTGTGSGQPSGVVTGAALGKAGASGQVATVTYADIVDLQHSVDPAYRTDAEWMFADSTLKALKKLVDGEQRPLWAPGIAVKEPDTILSHRYVINQDVAAMAASAKSILFGDFSQYLIRDVTGADLLILRERYADYLQVGFISFSRHDGALIDAGTDPIKFYQNAAS